MSSTAFDGAPYLFSQPGTFAAPYTFKVPATLEMRTDAASATYDGTGAGGDFLPALSFYSPEGIRLCTVPVQTTALSPGQAAEVSWFPFALAAPSGGGTVTFQEGVYGGNQVTIGTGASADLDWRYVHGDQVLNLGTHTVPRATVSGVYAVAMNILDVGPGTAGDKFVFSLVLNAGGANQGQVDSLVTWVAGTTAMRPALALTYFVPVGLDIVAIVNNLAAGDHTYQIQNASVQLIAAA